MPPAARDAGMTVARGVAWHADTPSRSTKARAARAPFVLILDDRRVRAAWPGDICIVGELFLPPQLEAAIQILDQVRPGRREIVFFPRVVHLIPHVISSVRFREEKLDPRPGDRGLKGRSRLDDY